MADVTLSLPDDVRDWLEERARTREFDDAGAYVETLIRRDQERVQKIAAMQKLVDEALAGGVSDKTPEEIFEEARARHCLT